MDFFGAQEQARRQTRRLVVLFLLAVVGVIAAVYLAVTVIFTGSGQREPASLWNPDLFFTISVITTLFIAGGSLYKISALAAGGGEAVAESLGGRRVNRSTEDPLERRLLNVVDEMAIASGIPVPKVYILDEELGINAFAAGFSTQSAVVTVTRGSLEQLTRDELQGVVAHEFSHILNGDMRLNLRLIGVLYGILLLALLGRIILSNTRISNRSRNGGGIVFFGFALLVIGYIGVFFGNLIKAAASRQREFLADASAVQFTRNPDGIAGALKKIGGFETSAIHHPRAEEASHMYFGEGISTLFNWFATHPPIEERIRRIDRTFRFEVQQQGASGLPQSGAVSGFAASTPAAPTSRQVVESVGTVAAEHVAYARQMIEKLPPSIRTAMQQPEQARLLIYALLVVENPQPLQVLQHALANETAESIQQTAAQAEVLKGIGRAAWLPILEMVMPVLDENDGPHVERLLANTKRLIESDARITLFEYLVDSLLRMTLGGKPGERGSIHRYPRKNALEDCQTVVSLLAHLGHRELNGANSAFDAAMQHLLRNESMQLKERSSLSLPHFDQALTRLATLDHRFRAQIIEACTTAITYDGQITILEAELLRIIGAKLDCPIPPLLANA